MNEINSTWGNVTINNNVKAVRYKEGFLYIPDSLMKARELKNQNEAVLVDIKLCSDSFEFPYVYEGPNFPSEDYLRIVFCRQKGIPNVIAKLDGFIIREEKVTDIDDLYDIYDDDAVRAYIEPLSDDREAEKASREVYIKQYYPLYGFGMWVIEDTNTGKVVGRVGFEISESESDTVELGFMIGREYRHRGLAKVSIRAALEYMSRNYSDYKIKAECRKENTTAIKLCKLHNVDVIQI